MLPATDLTDLGRIMKFSKARAKPVELRVKHGKKITPLRHDDIKLYQQRVIVKSSIRKVKARRGESLHGAFKAHLSYIGRDGTGIDGKRPELFTRSDMAALPTREIENEKHFFKFIVSPEQGSKIDLKDYTRDIMNTAERMTGKKLDWVASCHYNTDNPHVHIVVRGVADQKELRFSREFMSQGMRQIAVDRATLELGHRTTLDIHAQKTKEITSERFTSLDRQLKSSMDRHNVVTPQNDYLFHRCEHLTHIGLAMHHGKNQYLLSDNFEDVLKHYGYREDIQKRVFHDLPDTVKPIYICTDSMSVSGRVVAKDYENEQVEKPYVVIESDNKLYYAADYKLSRVKVGQDVTIDIKDNKIERIQETTKGIDR